MVNFEKRRDESEVLNLRPLLGKCTMPVMKFYILVIIISKSYRIYRLRIWQTRLISWKRSNPPEFFWLGHVGRMGEECPVKRAYIDQPTGRTDWIKSTKTCEFQILDGEQREQKKEEWRISVSVQGPL